jgi:hypothetical protein
VTASGLHKVGSGSVGSGGNKAPRSAVGVAVPDQHSYGEVGLYFGGGLLNMRSILSSSERIASAFSFAASIAWVVF